MARKTYPSDVTREQFEQIRPWLESARKHTKPRTLDLYEVFCAVVYVLKSGWETADVTGRLSKVALRVYLLPDME